jgi:hypothetical protein
MSVGGDTAHRLAERIVNDDGPAVAEGFDRVSRVRGHDGHATGPGDLSAATDRDFKLVLDDG